MRFFDRSRRRVLVLAAAAVLAAVLAVPALAQSATDEAGTPTEEAAPAERFADHQAEFAEALADELGLPVDQVTEALTNVRERLREQRMEERQAALRDRLDEAVANGQLTQEQADAIAEAAEAGVLGRRGLHGNGFGHHRHGHGGPRGWFGGPEVPGLEGTTPDARPRARRDGTIVGSGTGRDGRTAVPTMSAVGPADRTGRVPGEGAGRR